MLSDKDIIERARAAVASGCPCGTCNLIRALADEVERLRKQTVTMAQDARHDAQAAADEAYWRDKQGDEYGSY